MTTPYWSDFVRNSTFYQILSGFHRTFATGVACRQRTLTPPYTWSHPFGTCICSTCWDQSYSELVVIFPDYALRISLGTFSILLHRKEYQKTKNSAKHKACPNLYQLVIWTHTHFLGHLWYRHAHLCENLNDYFNYFIRTRQKVETQNVFQLS